MIEVTSPKTATGKCPFSGHSDATTEVTTQDAFTNLYYKFTAGDPGDPANSEHASAIAANIEINELATQGTGDFIILGGQHMVIYHCTQEDKSFSLDDYHVISFRATDPNSSVSSGFTAMTSLSHIIPALSYFAKAYEQDPSNVELQGLIQGFFMQLTAAKIYLNSDEANGWFTNMSDSTGIYAHNKVAIRKMGNWLLDKVSNFLLTQKERSDGDHQSGVYDFRVTDVQEHFLPDPNGGAIGKSLYGSASAMGSTFFMVVMEVVYNLTTGTTGTAKYIDILNSIDWEKVKVILSGQTGSLASGVNVTTNSTLKIVQFFAEHVTNQKTAIPRENIYIEPFISIPEGNATGTTPVNGWSNPADEVTAKSYLTAFNAHWFNLTNRVEISQALFTNLRVNAKTIPELVNEIYTNTPSVETLIPIDNPKGTYEDTIDVLHRIALTMEDYTDTLSDSVVSYILDIWNKASQPEVSSFSIPGLDYSFPE